MKTETIQGNLLTLADEGKFHAIAHGCNCHWTMGAGIALQIAKKWPQALEADKTQTKKGDPSKLGGFSKATATDNDGNPFYILNLYTQFHWGKVTEKGCDTQEARLRYIGEAFNETRAFFESPEAFLLQGKNLSLGIPMIGAGLAGGNWTDIIAAIESVLSPVPGTLWVVEYKP